MATKPLMTPLFCSFLTRSNTLEADRPNGPTKQRQYYFTELIERLPGTVQCLRKRLSHLLDGRGVPRRYLAKLNPVLSRGIPVS